MLRMDAPLCMCGDALITKGLSYPVTLLVVFIYMFSILCLSYVYLLSADYFDEALRTASFASRIDCTTGYIAEADITAAAYPYSSSRSTYHRLDIARFEAAAMEGHQMHG